MNTISVAGYDGIESTYIWHSGELRRPEFCVGRRVYVE